ncbi:hypothetical protein CLV58_12531 [Spirosoma oryzae]|uniref:Uncharacterized protein n=1 Tax=Spirosoma oryzae TaxID=1469603 RepID=A0A2T0S8L7_9BACT|nr:hypothetical protein CLV58_12531 [Spirosoma oryzae]
MFFHVLKRVNYDQSLEQIEYDLGYDLGDYFFKDKSWYDKVRAAAKQMWLIINHSPKK